MGKALVINGLVVTNPLTTVTIADSPTEVALRKYLLANSTINTTEQESLTNLVESLIDANVWSKVKYFYPLLGGQLSDMILDVVDPTTEDIISNAGTTGLSVLNRCLVANNRINTYANIGTRAKSLDPTKLGFILAGNWFGTTYQHNSNGQAFMFRKSNNFGLEISTSTTVYAFPQFRCNGTDVSDSSNTQSYLNRLVFGNAKDGVCYLYWENVLKAYNNVDLSGFDISTAQSYGVLCNNRAVDYQYNFAALTEGLTNEEWTTVLYPAINTFLQAVGKRPL